MSDVKHVSINCKHNNNVLRARIGKVVAENFLDGHGSRVDITTLINQLTVLCSSIMWEHSDEIAEQYRAIIAENARESRRKP